MDRRTEIFIFRWIRPHFVVVFGIFTVFLAMLVGYIIAVTSDHVNALFPYISDTGTDRPESCIFGLLLNMASGFAFFIMFLRHRYIEKFNRIYTTRIHVVNDIGLFFGTLSAFGIMLVANFQETSVLAVHLIGAVLAFGLGLVYCAVQIYITFVTVSVDFSSKFQLYIRSFFTLISLLAFIGTFLGAAIAQSKINQKTKPILKWDSDQPGYSAHLVSTFCEWIMVIFFMMFFGTFYSEFKHLDSNIVLAIRQELDESGVSVSPVSNMLGSESSEVGPI